MQTLTVVNRMLGTMGETSLNSLLDEHGFKNTALSVLDQFNRDIQARGWWFNREELTITPSVEDSRLYIPGDAINIRCTEDPHIVQRGRVLYDTKNGTPLFTTDVDVKLVRLIPFEDVPEVAAAYIADDAVHYFQVNYDGDPQRTRILVNSLAMCRAMAYAEETRQARANLITSNVPLQRLKSLTRRARRFIRP